MVRKYKLVVSPNRVLMVTGLNELNQIIVLHLNSIRISFQVGF